MKTLTELSEIVHFKGSKLSETLDGTLLKDAIAILWNKMQNKALFAS